MDTIIEMMKGILSSKWVAYPVAMGLVALGLLTFVYMIWTIFVSYKIAKKTGKPTSWLKISDDIRWTMYCWSERDQAYVMSLPRLIYFISALLIIYVVIRGQAEMLVPLLGFNLSAMVSYSSKRYFEGKEEVEQIKINDDFKLKLAQLNSLCNVDDSALDTITEAIESTEDDSGNDEEEENSETDSGMAAKAEF